MENLCDTCKYANEDICGCDGEPIENINSEECCKYLKKIPTFEEIVKMSDEEVKNITTEEWMQIYGHENRTEEEKKEISTMIELLKCFPPYIIKATLARKVMENKSGTNADRDDNKEKRKSEKE